MHNRAAHLAEDHAEDVALLPAAALDVLHHLRLVVAVRGVGVHEGVREDVLAERRGIGGQHVVRAHVVVDAGQDLALAVVFHMDADDLDVGGVGDALVGQAAVVVQGHAEGLARASARIAQESLGVGDLVLALADEDVLGHGVEEVALPDAVDERQALAVEGNRAEGRDAVGHVAVGGLDADGRRRGRGPGRGAVGHRDVGGLNERDRAVLAVRCLARGREGKLEEVLVRPVAAGERLHDAHGGRAVRVVVGDVGHREGAVALDAVGAHAKGGILALGRVLDEAIGIEVAVRIVTRQAVEDVRESSAVAARREGIAAIRHGLPDDGVDVAHAGHELAVAVTLDGARLGCFDKRVGVTLLDVGRAEQVDRRGSDARGVVAVFVDPDLLDAHALVERVGVRRDLKRLAALVVADDVRASGLVGVLDLAVERAVLVRDRNDHVLGVGVDREVRARGAHLADRVDEAVVGHVGRDGAAIRVRKLGASRSELREVGVLVRDRVEALPEGGIGAATRIGDGKRRLKLVQALALGARAKRRACDGRELEAEALPCRPLAAKEALLDGRRRGAVGIVAVHEDRRELGRVAVRVDVGERRAHLAVAVGLDVDVGHVVGEVVGQALVAVDVSGLFVRALVDAGNALGQVRVVFDRVKRGLVPVHAVDGDDLVDRVVEVTHHGALGLVEPEVLEAEGDVLEAGQVLVGANGGLVRGHGRSLIVGREGAGLGIGRARLRHRGHVGRGGRRLGRLAGLGVVARHDSVGHELEGVGVALEPLAAHKLLDRGRADRRGLGREVVLDALDVGADSVIVGRRVGGVFALSVLVLLEGVGILGVDVLALVLWIGLQVEGRNGRARDLLHGAVIDRVAVGVGRGQLAPREREVAGDARASLQSLGLAGHFGPGAALGAGRVRGLLKREDGIQDGRGREALPSLREREARLFGLDAREGIDDA